MSTAGTPRIDIYGVQFDTLDMPDVIRQIIEQRSRGAGGGVARLNLVPHPRRPQRGTRRAGSRPW